MIMMHVLAKSKPEPGLWLEQRPIPVPGYGEILIKVRKTAICGTDLHIYQWDSWAQQTVPVPLVVGHEFMGQVTGYGDGVSEFNLGDRVAGEGHITCGHCRNCRGGRRVLCRNTQGIGVNCPGAFAEYVVMPAKNVIRLPDDISDDQAAILDPYGNAVHSSLEFNIIGEDVLITGAGPVGMMSAAIARHVGARHIVISDINDYRLRLAEQMGATHAINPSNTDIKAVMADLGMTEGFDIGLEMSGNPHAFQSMLSTMNHGGRIAFLGIPSERFAIDWSEVVFKSLTIKGIYGRRLFDTWYTGISMLQSSLNITPVITGCYSYRQYEQAFADMLAGNSGKVLLDWEQ